MRKRSLCLGLLLLASLLSEGCCWCHRPMLFRRWCWGRGCCEPFATSCYSAGCCDAGAAPAVIDSYGVPSVAPAIPGGTPTMPGANPLVRARLGVNK